MSIKDWIDVVIAVGTLLTAGTAIFLTLRQSKWQRRHDYASVRPVLVILTDMSRVEVEGRDAMRLDICMKNAGLGPAKFKSITVTYDGEETDFWSLGDIVLKGFEKCDVFGFSAKKNYALAPGDSQRLALYLLAPREPLDLDSILTRFEPARVKIVYTSIHEERDFELEHEGSELRIEQKFSPAGMNE